MLKVGILGATGYTAYELIRILLRNPKVEIVAATTRQEGNPPIHEIHPSLHGRLDLNCENLSAEEVGQRCDYVFCALPHVASMTAVPDLLAGGARVIDLSADYRLTDPAVYEKWYGHVHTDPTRLGDTVYGLPELYRDKIPGNDLVANPGCYTSTSILALTPLVKHNLIESTGIIIDAKSGVSGAGRSPKLGTLFAECNESLSAYGVGTHRHQPEIEQILSDVSDSDVAVTFTPHLIPMDRGILCTIYPQLKESTTQDKLLELYRDFYADSPFVRIVDHLPRTKDVTQTNYIDITVRFNRDQLIVLAALDNLIKGAAGVAVQNFNLLAGFDETTALIV
ncbi:N-acetyl-gamma-glutamyl-phosphate reductase [Planctomycetaceae bacterium]|jgi:N-acetyl-gamma-glutamyl-phosphate reductase|nr:N-acetyl-gamma-glutamyl-phosphate reductase [Planctomycetaceae bacterium]MDC0262318.1 N-acetyl-gamma-glutamyl-phosphate reductase [Planctomycetaceae bacterium]MDC0274024.1 N-acetyl-gamma-glutamyl-phosphate reductase [Planctomycetaceae bacterium]MDC0308199.1 N-acetyl-gamma-glutamyl-phosphate reductase [Planctomycetaceae bacterium]MDG2388084.1 N-acetyl-gamma-glutamyl-phosphate reductase [Planctomycetaceae bacterium]